MKRTALLVALAVFGAALAVDATYTFKVVRKVGETTKTRVTAHVEVQGMQVDQTFVTEEKVEKIADDGTVTLKTQMKDQKLSLNGQDQPAPTPEGSSTTKIKSSGELIESDRQEGQPLDVQQRLSRTSSLIPPKEAVKVGDSWTHVWEQSDKEKLARAEITYKVVAEEKVGKWDCVRVEFTFKEKEGAAPITATGAVWLAKDTFQSAKSEYTVENFEAPGVPMPLTVKLKTERID